MTQTTNRFLDEFAKLMTDAAGAADGMQQRSRDADASRRASASCATWMWCSARSSRR